jgi:hypothetical protein
MYILKIKNKKTQNGQYNKCVHHKGYRKNSSDAKYFILNKIKPVSVLFMFLLFLFAAMSLSFLPESEAAMHRAGGTGPLSLSGKNTMFYTGTIIAISNSTLKLSGKTPLTFIINSSTVCYVGSGVHSRTGSCSDYKKGQSLKITASENTAGKLIAKTITPVFY